MSRTIAGIVALGIALCFGGIAQAAPQYSLTCIDCHQMPPLDSPTGTRDSNTGAFKGNHQAHAGTTAATCVKCHGNQVTSYTTSHRTKQIQMQQGNINGSPLGAAAAYSRTFFNQTSVPPATLGSCSSVNCHFEAASPAWGGTAFAAPADCSQCHLVAPNTGNHPVLGSKHGNYLGTGTGSCLKCHPNHLTEAKPFAHATSAANRGIKVQFTTAPNSGGTYSDSGLNFLPSQGKSSYGNCSNLYCHSDGKGGPANVASPTWGASLNCKGCHNSNLASGAAMNTGKHTVHVDNAGFIGSNYGCAECHAQTVSNDTTIASYPNHVKGFVSVSGARTSKNYNTTNKACNSTYCHSDGKGGYKNIAWNSPAALDCKGCHGSDSAPDFTPSYGAPNYASVGGAGAPKANTHKVHVSGAGDCVNCHSQTTTDGISINGNGKHTNGAIDLAAGPGKSFTPGANKTCSNISCHSGNGKITGVGTAQWGATLGCNGCHGDATSTSPVLSAAHAKHVNPTTGKSYTCDNCHSWTVSGNSTIIDITKHGDSTVEINGVKIPTASYTAATKTCATTCHLSATPQWDNLASGACGTCHKALSTTTFGLISTNAHRTHFTTRNYGPNYNSTTATSCANCHTGYTTDTAANHDNGIVELGTGFNKIGTCSTCHQQTTNWTTGRVSCESCHTTTGGPLSVISGVPAPDKTLAATAGHGQAGIGQQCTACHDNNSAHISGTLGDNKRLTASLTGSGNTECNFCHNDPAKVTNTAKQITQGHVGFGNACVICHEPHGTTNSNMVQTRMSSVTVAFSGSNFVNAQGTGVCQACHTATAYYRRNVAETNHATTGCITCHPHKGFDGITAFEPNRACDSCHGYPPAPRVVTTATTFGVQGNWSSARFEDYSGGGGAHIVAKHLAKDIKPSDGWTPCLMCHSGGAATHAKAIPVRSHVENVTVKVDPQYRFSNGYFIVYTSAKLVSGGANKTGSCFNVSCHFAQTPKWSIER